MNKKRLFFAFFAFLAPLVAVWHWPSMTTAQRLAIASPTPGLHVYDTDLVPPYFYDGTNWGKIVRLPAGGATSNFFRGDGVFTNIVPIAPTNNGAYVLFVTNGVASWIAHP